MKAKKKEKNIVAKIFTKVLLSIIFLLISIIFINQSDKSLLKYKNVIFKKSLSFNQVNSLYKKYIGDILFMKKDTSAKVQSVFDEEISYKSKEKFHDGYKLTVDESYLMPSLQSGIVVYSGNKENYNKCIIVQGMDGVDIWYCNLASTNLKMYDYIEKKSLIGQVNGKKAYIVLQKDGKYISLDEYLEKNQS